MRSLILIQRRISGESVFVLSLLRRFTIRFLPHGDFRLSQNLCYFIGNVMWLGIHKLFILMSEVFKCGYVKSPARSIITVTLS